MTWCLRLTVALQAAGMAGRYLFSSAETESDVYGLLYFDWDWDEGTALAIDAAGSWFCVVAGGLVLLAVPFLDHRSRWSRASAASVTVVSLTGVAAWFIAVAVAHTLRGEPYAEWTLPDHAVRYTTPIVLLLLLGHPGPVRIAVGNVVLRLAVAMTFLGHGYKAIQHHGHFVDLLLLTDAGWFGLGLTQSGAETLLTWIGWLDVIVAVGVVVAPRRGPAAYAMVWGTITGFSRMTALGIAAWPETLVRAANGGAPLALALYPRTTTTDAPPHGDAVEPAVPS